MEIVRKWEMFFSWKHAILILQLLLKFLPELSFSLLSTRMLTDHHPLALQHGSSRTVLQIAPSPAGGCLLLCQMTSTPASVLFRCRKATAFWRFSTTRRPQRRALKRQRLNLSINIYTKTKQPAKATIFISIATTTEPDYRQGTLLWMCLSGHRVRRSPCGSHTHPAAAQLRPSCWCGIKLETWSGAS